jgi:hypothetical protein
MGKLQEFDVRDLISPELARDSVPALDTGFPRWLMQKAP